MTPNKVPETLGLDEIADPALIEAARPLLVNAAKYFNWNLDATGASGVLGGTAGLATRIRDHAVAPFVPAPELVQGPQLLTVDILLFCLCDALSRKTGASFELTTMVAFGPSPNLLKKSESIDKAVEDMSARHNLAAILFNIVQAEPDIHVCFATIGTASHRFLVQPDTAHIEAVTAGYQQLHERLQVHLAKLNNAAPGSPSRNPGHTTAARRDQKGAGCLGAIFFLVAVPCTILALIRSGFM